VSTAATRDALEELARPLTRRVAAGGGALALGLLLVGLGAAAWLARLEVVRALWWVPAAWVVALGLAGAAAIAVRRRLRGLGAASLAGELEARGAWRLGALTGMLQPAAAGVSGELHAAADRARAADLAARGGEEVAPFAARARRGTRAGAMTLLAGAVTLMAAGPGRSPVRMLWHPAEAVGLALAPIRIEASASSLDRGDSVALTVSASGRREAVLWLRAPGEAWHPTALALDSAGLARTVIGPLTTDLFAHATTGGRDSDTLQVAVRIPAFLGAVTVTAQYPGYLGMEDELLAIGRDSVMLPEGTRLVLAGEASAPLSAARWIGPTDSAALDVRGARFGGRVTPKASGRYRLSVATAGGAPLAGDSVSLILRLVSDSAPTVTIPVPGEDTLAPVAMTVPLVIDARDDHGLGSVTLVSRRISRLGLAEPERREAVTLPEGTPDRLMAPFTLSLLGRSLLPGDTVRYYAVATDNAPRPHTGRSRDYVLRLPTLAELRAAERASTESVGTQLDSLSAASKRLQRQTEDMARSTPRTTAGQDRPGESTMSFDEAKRAETVAKQQEELVRQAEETRQAIADLQRAAEQAGVADPEFQKRLQEIAQQLDRALTPEMRQQLEALRQALSQLDAARAQQALEQLAEAQKQLKEALERSQKLFERAALEGAMANLAAEARDLAAEQAQWNDAVAQADSARAASAERSLAERTDSLASDLRATAQEMEKAQSPTQAERMEAMARAAESAAGQMTQAAGSASQGKRQQAAKQGQQAQQQLAGMDQQLGQERSAMQQAWRKEVVSAIDRMMAETSRLADRQLEVTESLRAGESPSAFRAQQAAVQEGVEKLAEQYRAVSGENALVSPQIGTSLEAARRQMEQARDAVASAVQSPREAGARAGQAVDALNAAAYQMARARGDVAGAASGSGMAEAMARMAQMAQQQGQLSQQGASLLPMVGGGAMQEQIRQLSAQQRALAEQLERLRAQTQSPGAGELADEARDLANQTEAGRLDRRTVERQERLYRRMLDAGRTLQGEQEDEQKERQSTTGSQDSVRLPPALRAQLEDANHRLRLPTWEQLQQLAPEDRQLVMDYFRRLAEAPAR
jgi:hypothetical protein